jgi:hypothetical protein
MLIHIPFHWTLRTHTGRSPALFNAVFRCTNDGDRLVRRNTDLVLEGFPRSGNSFSVFAFMNAGAGDMNIAHHVHSPSQVISAARYKIPAVLLIREPKAAAAAGIAKIATHSAGDLLRAYSIYYRTLLPLRENFVIAPFDTLTSDVGRVIDAVNRRFQTAFDPIDAARHEQLSKAFLAQEKLDALATPPVPNHAPPAFDSPERLTGPATQLYRTYLELAAQDGTA